MSDEVRRRFVGTMIVSAVVQGESLDRDVREDGLVTVVGFQSSTLDVSAWPSCDMFLNTYIEYSSLYSSSSSFQEARFGHIRSLKTEAMS